MSVQKWPCLQSGSAQRSGAAAPGQPRPENGGGCGGLGGSAGQAGRSASPSGQRPRLLETGRGIESLSGGDWLGTGGPGLEAVEAGSSPSGGAPGTGPEWGHRGSCPASRPAFHPKEARGLPSLRVHGRHPPRPCSHSQALPLGTGWGPPRMAASSRHRPSPGWDQPGGCSKTLIWAGTVPTRGRGAGKGGPGREGLDCAAILSLQSLSRLSQTRWLVAWPGVSVVLRVSL